MEDFEQQEEDNMPAQISQIPKGRCLFLQYVPNASIW